MIQSVLLTYSRLDFIQIICTGTRITQLMPPSPAHHLQPAAKYAHKHQLTIWHFASGDIFFYRRHGIVITVCRVSQENQAKYGHEILIRYQVRICPQVVRYLPKIRLELLNAVEMTIDGRTEFIFFVILSEFLSSHCQSTHT